MPGQGGPAQAGGPAGAGGGTPHPGTGFTGYAAPGSPQTFSMHHPPLHDAHHYGYYPQGTYQTDDAQDVPGYSLFGLDFSDGNFWKGALIGAAVTLLVTNDTVQKALMTGVAKAYSAAQNGVGELKEKFEDAQAELRKPKE
ncbi:MAG: YtxH domain-containing protein [Pseudomonadota bacterium]